MSGGSTATAPMTNTSQRLAPSQAPREWQIETGNYIDPEPDWAWDPAVNPVDGTKYYNSGRVVAADGTEICTARDVLGHISNSSRSVEFFC